MGKKSTWLLAALGALPVVLAALGHVSREAAEPLLHHKYAHRGLHEKDKSVPENSLAAFARACEAGYGMELDVQLSADGQVVVFHDDDLKRVCGVEKDVCELTFDELRELRLCGTEERIPLFTEVLELVAGRTPMIVELKSGGRNDELCEKTLEILRGYDGVYCIESFNPAIVAWFRKHAPQIVRGQLAMQRDQYDPQLMGGLGPYLLSNTCLNVIARPHFIAYRVGRKAPLVKLAELMGVLRAGWTIRDPKDEEGFDIVIFEFYKA
ncbi:MAG: glycerophosphodiester phosphodiesterase [Lachnospiraceae bacterium]|nr:glycerophosphodiester phosphodiesterase [Lachnospiraceae bacterium]